MHAKDTEAMKRDFAWHTHEYINEYIRFADGKAGFVFTWASAFMGGLYSTGFHSGINCSAIGALRLLGILLLLVGIVCGFLAIIPNLTRTKSSGFVFWQRILAHGSAEKYAIQFKASDIESLETELATHLYELSSVAEKKYRRIAMSIWCTLAGSLLSTVLVLWFSK